MFGQTNLDQLAWDYIQAPTLYRSEQREALIRSGAAAVYPLLRAGLRSIAEFKTDYFIPSVEMSKQSEFGEGFAYHFWLEMKKDFVREHIYDIVAAMGQPAMDALCRALWESDEGIQVLAALTLFEEEKPSSRTVKGVKDAFKALMDNWPKKFLLDSNVIALLYMVLARGGDDESERFVTDFIAKRDMSVEEYVEKSRNTSLVYLLER